MLLERQKSKKREIGEGQGVDVTTDWEIEYYRTNGLQPPGPRVKASQIAPGIPSKVPGHPKKRKIKAYENCGSDPDEGDECTDLPSALRSTDLRIDF